MADVQDVIRTNVLFQRKSLDALRISKVIYTNNPVGAIKRISILIFATKPMPKSFPHNLYFFALGLSQAAATAAWIYMVIHEVYELWQQLPDSLWI